LEPSTAPVRHEDILSGEESGSPNDEDERNFEKQYLRAPWS